MRSTTTSLFGLGAGCEGAMDILLTRVSVARQLAAARIHGERRRRGAALPRRLRDRQPSMRTSPSGCTCSRRTVPHGGSVIASELLAIGSAARDAERQHADPPAAARRGTVHRTDRAAAAPAVVRRRAGRAPGGDAGAFLGWRVTVVDHRASYLAPERFPPGTALIEVAARGARRAAATGQVRRRGGHEPSPGLRPAVPARAGAQRGAVRRACWARRRGARSCSVDLGADAAQLRDRLRAPVGLDIGGRTPESIALAIVGEVHAALAGRAGRPFTELTADERGT